jgi:hypothetical protein
MSSGEGIRDRRSGGGFGGGVPRSAGSFGSVPGMGKAADATADRSVRARPERRPAASAPLEIRRLVRDAPEPVLARWSAPIRLALLLSGAVLSWALFMLLARLLFE